MSKEELKPIDWSKDYKVIANEMVNYFMNFPYYETIPLADNKPLHEIIGKRKYRGVLVSYDTAERLAINQFERMKEVCPELTSKEVIYNEELGMYVDDINPTYTKITECINYLKSLK